MGVMGLEEIWIKPTENRYWIAYLDIMGLKGLLFKHIRYLLFIHFIKLTGFEGSLSPLRELKVISAWDTWALIWV